MTATTLVLARPAVDALLKEARAEGSSNLVSFPAVANLSASLMAAISRLEKQTETVNVPTPRQAPSPSPPPPSAPPPSPSPPPPSPSTPNKDSEDLPKAPDNPDDTLIAVMIVTIVVVLMALCCLLCAKNRRLKKEMLYLYRRLMGSTAGPTFVAPASGYSGTNSVSKANLPSVPEGEGGGGVGDGDGDVKKEADDLSMTRHETRPSSPPTPVPAAAALGVSCKDDRAHARASVSHATMHVPPKLAAIKVARVAMASLLS